MRLLIGALLLLMGAWGGTGHADAAEGGITVRALVDRNQVQPGESLRLRVVVGGEDGVVDLSPLTDFEIHSQGTATQISMINRRTTREVTHTYQLIPRRTGSLTIPALTVDVNGTRLRTQPIQITVAARTDTTESAQDIFVEVDLSEDQPYVGQQIRYTFTLYQGVQITDGRLEQPDFSGFEAHEFEERPTRRTVVSGREYLVTEVVYLLIPLAPGPVTIAPARLSFGLVQRHRRKRSGSLDDFFNDNFFSFSRTQVEPRLLTSKALQVSVRPLPAYRGDGVFSGLVGQFSLRREVAQTALTVGESTTLTVRISGRGNIRDAVAPPLAIPQDFKTYTDTPSAEIQMDGRGFSGNKIFRTALVPVTTGTFQLPESRLVYFDPFAEAFREVRTDVIELAVTAGEPGTETTVAVMATPGQQTDGNKQKVAFTGKDILPLKEGLDALKPSPRLGRHLFWALLLLPALGFALLGGAMRLLKPAADGRSRMRREARQALRSAAANAPADRFLTALRRALVAAVMGATGGSGAALTASEVELRLEQGGFSGETAGEAARLLEEIDGYHYSGASLGDDAREDLRRRLGSLIKKVFR
ncbi:MAG: BatD family protein [Desulfosarcinaceae bacterium]|nr:BatD family protein [Desulfosarcinaceae bacterium]